MQNTLWIRYAFCACAYGVLYYLEPSIVFKAKVARHVRISYYSNLPWSPQNKTIIYTEITITDNTTKI